MLLEDRIRGGLWMGGNLEGGEGLTYFDGNRFISPVRGPFPKAAIQNITEDSEGGLWIATPIGLYRFFGGELTLMVGSGAGNVLEAGPTVILAVTADGTKGNELLRFSKASGGKWKAEAMLAMPGLSSLVKDHDGKFLFACPGGYCEFLAEDAVRWRMGETLQVTRRNAPALAEANNTVKIILRDRFGCIWFERRRELQFQCPGEAVNADANLVLPISASAIELADGKIVIFSFSKLAIGRPGNFRIITSLNGFPGAISVVATKDGSLWLSNGNGLFVLPPRRMEFWTEREGLNGNTWSILRTPHKTFAIAGEELRLLDQERSRWNLLPIGRVDLMKPGPRDTILTCFDRGGTGPWRQVSSSGEVMGKQYPCDEDLNFDGAKTDPEGVLWRCSNNGLLHKSPEWRPIKVAEGPPIQACRYFAIAGNGDIWLTTAEPETGFTLVERPGSANPRTRNFLSGGEVGIAQTRFFGIDQRGWIWRGSPSGIYVADSEEARRGEWLYLNRLDGIAGTDANRRSFFSDPDGSVWFGLDNSINHVYPPNDFVHPAASPDLFVSGFSWDGGAFQMASQLGAIPNSAATTAHIGSLQYDRRNALRLRYRLLPDQPKWQETASLDLPLGVLSTGSHTLQVQGRIFSGPWSRTVTHSFSVLQPAWIRAPFLFLYGLTGSLLVASLEWLRRRQQNDEQNLLPNLTELRVRVLAADEQKMAGTLLDGRFEVRKVLARGGFATVLTGYDKREGRICAVKIFRSEVRSKASIFKGFEQEVAALKEIRHPNVVSIYADGRTPDGAPYLAMEFIAGESLRDILNNKPLPRLRTARLLAQLAAALDEIHARRICHRDLKPENVVVRNSGSEDEQAVLIDFSIAIIKDANETLHGLSRAAGTFDYMAPEQALGHAQPASDVFSLAKVLIEMLTGFKVSVLLPNEALHLAEKIPPVLRGFDLGLSEESLNMLGSALEFDPSRRPHAAGEFSLPIVSDLKKG